MIVLASTSPFRKKLMERLGVPFRAESPLFDEETFKSSGLPPGELVELLSRRKAESLLGRFPNDVLIGSDQVLLFENQIFGKPLTEEKAVADLMLFQGKWHELLTGVCVMRGGEAHYDLNRTRMKMRPLTRAECERYVALEKPLQSAGSYKIEGLGISLFEEMEIVDPTAIEGLPMVYVCARLRDFGVLLP